MMTRFLQEAMRARKSRNAESSNEHTVRLQPLQVG